MWGLQLQCRCIAEYLNVDRIHPRQISCLVAQLVESIGNVEVAGSSPIQGSMQRLFFKHGFKACLLLSCTCRQTSSDVMVFRDLLRITSERPPGDSKRSQHSHFRQVGCQSFPRAVLRSATCTCTHTEWEGSRNTSSYHPHSYSGLRECLHLYKYALFLSIAYCQYISIPAHNVNSFPMLHVPMLHV